MVHLPQSHPVVASAVWYTSPILTWRLPVLYGMRPVFIHIRNGGILIYRRNCGLRALELSFQRRHDERRLRPLPAMQRATRTKKKKKKKKKKKSAPENRKFRRRLGVPEKKNTELDGDSHSKPGTIACQQLPTTTDVRKTDTR